MKHGFNYHNICNCQLEYLKRNIVLNLNVSVGLIHLRHNIEHITCLSFIIMKLIFPYNFCNHPLRTPHPYIVYDI